MATHPTMATASAWANMALNQTRVTVANERLDRLGNIELHLLNTLESLHDHISIIPTAPVVKVEELSDNALWVLERARNDIYTIMKEMHEIFGKHPSLALEEIAVASQSLGRTHLEYNTPVPQAASLPPQPDVEAGPSNAPVLQSTALSPQTNAAAGPSGTLVLQSPSRSLHTNAATGPSGTPVLQSGSHSSHTSIAVGPNGTPVLQSAPPPPQPKAAPVLSQYVVNWKTTVSHGMGYPPTTPRTPINKYNPPREVSVPPKTPYVPKFPARPDPCPTTWPWPPAPQFVEPRTSSPVLPARWMGPPPPGKGPGNTQDKGKKRSFDEREDEGPSASTSSAKRTRREASYDENALREQAAVHEEIGNWRHSIDRGGPSLRDAYSATASPEPVPAPSASHIGAPWRLRATDTPVADSYAHVVPDSPVFQPTSPPWQPYSPTRPRRGPSPEPLDDAAPRYSSTTLPSASRTRSPVYNPYPSTSEHAEPDHHVPIPPTWSPTGPYADEEKNEDELKDDVEDERITHEATPEIEFAGPFHTEAPQPRRSSQRQRRSAVPRGSYRGA